MLDELPESMDIGESISVTPAADHLFTVDTETGTKIDAGLKVIFHTNIAKLMFLSKRTRPDVQIPVAFLCTRVKEPDRDNWKKLGRIMKYLEGTIGLTLILGIDDTGVVKWFVDASFAVHNDMKSHTVMFISMGK